MPWATCTGEWPRTRRFSSLSESRTPRPQKPPRPAGPARRADRHAAGRGARGFPRGLSGRSARGRAVSLFAPTSTDPFGRARHARGELLKAPPSTASTGPTQSSALGGASAGTRRLGTRVQPPSLSGGAKAKRPRLDWATLQARTFGEDVWRWTGRRQNVVVARSGRRRRSVR